MSVNHYKPHLLVLPEDDADRQIANGISLELSINPTRIQILPFAGGWHKVRESLSMEIAATLNRYEHAYVLAIVDFDGNADRRMQVLERVPEELCHRVFVMGCASEPEVAKKK